MKKTTLADLPSKSHFKYNPNDEGTYHIIQRMPNQVWIRKDSNGRTNFDLPDTEVYEIPQPPQP